MWNLYPSVPYARIKKLNSDDHYVFRFVVSHVDQKPIDEQKTIKKELMKKLSGSWGISMTRPAHNIRLGILCSIFYVIAYNESDALAIAMRYPDQAQRIKIIPKLQTFFYRHRKKEEN